MVVDVVDVVSAFKAGEPSRTNMMHLARRIDELTASAKLVVCAWCYSGLCPFVHELVAMCSRGALIIEA